ncbi:putative mitochondrial DNA polymerase I protein C [Trypanosoma grayi]|uniref:putative mitochondrial DNA polymerase I protein C n=1 Tax=Trypanosoma grayi TaxID=71804 RepID=UPI0004F453B4|nr:putative mitochondrial DNA polymerase I protein C [Trypanosoma grayi]KEG10347.1 putative mitochondrial DNA polymerase I protein C [Trypanosoma grayi]
MQRTLRRCAQLLLMSQQQPQQQQPCTRLPTVLTTTGGAAALGGGRRCVSLPSACGALRECRRCASSVITRGKRRPKSVLATATSTPTVEVAQRRQQQQQERRSSWQGAAVKSGRVENVAKDTSEAMTAVVSAKAQMGGVKASAFNGTNGGRDDNVRSSAPESAETTTTTATARTVAAAMTTERSSGTGNPAAAEIGSLLDLENPLNLRLATLMQQPGKAFRAIAVTFSPKRDLNFSLTFEDVASKATLRCRLNELQSVYLPWVRQFRASWVTLFLPTLSGANAVLLENALLYNGAGRSATTGAVGQKEVEEPDHLLLSYSKLREMLCKKKRDEQVNGELLSNAVLNAYADDWRSFIHAPGACAPMAIVTAAFDFQPCVGQPLLNKQLLHAQLSVVAAALQPPGKRGTLSSSSRGGGKSSSSNAAKKKEFWMLVFVSAPLPSALTAGSAAPPMQDLLTGEFVEPLLLAEKNVIYIIGTGSAAEAFAQFPLVRKGKQKVSVLLQDIENQLGLRRPNRPTLTMTLTQALDLFSRYTWMGLMYEEDGTLRVPRPVQNFTPVHRRSVTCEIVPSFLESALGRAHAGVGIGGGGAAAAGGMPGGQTFAQTKMSRRLDEHIKAIFNNGERLAREKEWHTRLRACSCFFLEVRSANVTAARRADNPFSARNGIVEFHGQLWRSLDTESTPPVETLTAKVAANGDIKSFVELQRCIPDGLPTGSSSSDKKNKGSSGNLASHQLASNGIIIAWDVKRALLFLRESGKLQQFLRNGGRIWCAQYAQYLLKGFNHHNLASMERTLLQYHTGKVNLHPLEKLKIIFEKQLDIAVNTRQLISILHRMDGLLAATEMETRGLQLAPQADVTAFSHNLKASHEKLEKLVNDKIMEFTTGMDDEVRKRINFRSPQDISTIIYGGALCRHLGARYVPLQSPKTPVTALFPHAVCCVTATPVPALYKQPESLVGPKGVINRGSRPAAVGPTESGVRAAVTAIEKYTSGNTLENLLHCTAVVVVTCKVRPGNFLEMFCMHCPSTDPNGELKYNVAIDDVVPVTDEPEMLTVIQLKEKIASYKPLRALQPLKKYGKRSYDLRNLLILTNCSPDRIAALVDTGIVQTLAETVLGKQSGDKAWVERVCFCDIQRALPPPPQGADSFESDFLGLVDVAEHAGYSARSNWEALSRDFVAVGGFEGGLKALVSHCASLMGTARDAFRTTQPLPLTLGAEQQGLHGQERASMRGLLWQVTPDHLHPLLHRSLRGRNASSGADAIERITVLLSSEQHIDLSFFKALQQLRFTEKKMQLFEEGALFRAVLPECKDRVHGELCHTVTATGRLSSQSPNLQNIPKEEDLRRLIVSRFGRSEGRMIEADYSQLEVVVLAALSRDTRMLQELREKVDFHCLRVSLMTKEPYADVVRKAKKEKDPHYIQLRQQAKTFSFQRQYGAGIATIATTTGLTEHEVERLIAAEEQHYKDLGRFYRLVMDCVEAGADRLLRLRTLDAATWPPAMRRMILLTEPIHYFVVPTGSKFDFSKDKKSIPRLKNYPVQGLAGEIVQIMCGSIIRRFYARRNYNDKAFLVNTVHDCVWIDAHASVADEVMRDVSDIMSSTSEFISTLWPDMKLDAPFNADIHIGPSLGELSR